MFIDVNQHPNASKYIKVINIKNNRKITHVAWANDETQTLGKYQRDKFGELKTELGEPIIKVVKSNFKLVPIC